MNFRILMLTGLFLLASAAGSAQKSEREPAAPGKDNAPASPDIAKYLAMVDAGQLDQARADLPALITKFPNDPAVLYLQGKLTTDGAEAVRIYQSVVDNFPKSEWADHALYKVYQFYYALGLYRTAELKMDQLRRDYPSSQFAKQGADVDSKSLAEERELPPPEIPADTVPATKVVSEHKAEFTLQVGAFTEQANAERQKQLFEELGMAVEIIHKVQDSRSLFLVHVGTYATYDEAKARGAEIKKNQNVDPIVISR